MPPVGAALSVRDGNKKLPNYIGTGIHELSLEHYNEDEDNLEAIDLYFDRNAQLFRLDIKDQDSKNTLIYSALSRAMYEITNGICKISLARGKDNMPENLKILNELLDDIELSHRKDYKYIGQAMVQEMLSDVYEFSREEKKGKVKIVNLIYVKHVSMLDVFNLFFNLRNSLK